MTSLDRRLATKSDFDFLYDLHKQTLGPYVERVWDWDEEDQIASFRQEFEPERNEVILAGGRPVGSLRVEDHGDHVFLDYLALVPDWQRRGVGTELVQRVVQDALERGLPLRLNCLKVNPAKALYERLGFRVIGEDEVRWFMELTPGCERAG